MARNTLARIDVDAVAHNLARVRQLAPNSRVMAVVKADAYGHRLDLCLPALAAADMLAVATLEEARAIRRLGSNLPVLLLEGLIHDGDLSVAADLGLELTIHHPAQVRALEQFGTAPTPRLWLKLDTGMHRLGMDAASGRQAHRQLLALPGVHQVNLVTHFASADAEEPTATREQMHRFREATSGLTGELCMANSAAILGHPDSHADWVRAGILLYGVSPHPDRTGESLGLKPVMTLTTELIAINEVSRGERIGYGGRFTAPADMRIGVAGIGYGDGYPRSLADGTPVRVGDYRCPLVGRVSMDMITLDVSAAPGVKIGDRVVLWGPGLPVEHIARYADTIAYELVCRITRRVRYRAF